MISFAGGIPRKNQFDISFASVFRPQNTTLTQDFSDFLVQLMKNEDAVKVKVVTFISASCLLTLHKICKIISSGTYLFPAWCYVVSNSVDPSKKVEVVFPNAPDPSKSVEF